MRGQSMEKGFGLDWKIRIRPYEWLIWAGLFSGITAWAFHSASLNFKIYKINFIVLLAFCLLYMFYSALLSLKKILKEYKHETITIENMPVLYATIKKIEEKTGTKVLPKAYVIEHKDSTAMALPWGIFGRSAIFLSEKLLEESSGDELESIIAHELGHIRCKEALIIIFQGLITVTIMQYLLFAKLDDLTQMFASSLTWKFVLIMLFYAVYIFGAVMLLSKFACNSLNKRSELYADSFAVMATGKSRPLIDFLQRKFDEYLDSSEVRNKKFAAAVYRLHMFLFSSDPTIMKRVEHLKDFE
jgi:Zn-dependent protease with chaperone function